MFGSRWIAFARPTPGLLQERPVRRRSATLGDTDLLQRAFEVRSVVRPLRRRTAGPREERRRAGSDSLARPLKPWQHGRRHGEAVGVALNGRRR